jgi:hypothetical protein
VTDELPEAADSTFFAHGSMASGKGKNSLGSSGPSALAIADTTTAGAGGAVPGSFQKLDDDTPEDERI